MTHFPRYRLTITAALLVSLAISAEEFTPTDQELVTFQGQIKEMLESQKLDEKLINRKLDFWYGDCDSGAFSKGTYRDAARLLGKKRDLDWTRISNFPESNHFNVDLRKPKGRNPEYQGSRFYFQKRRNGKIYWTGYCDLIQYK